MQFNTKNTKKNANTKATKDYIFGVLCINLCSLVLTGISFNFKVLLGVLL